MTYEIESLSRLRFAIEPTGSYAIINSVTASFTDIKILEATIELIGEQLTNETVQQRIDRQAFNINSRRRCNLSFTSYLNGTGVSASKGITAVASPVGSILKTVMGKETFGVGGGIVSLGGNRKYVTDFTTAAGSAFGCVNPTNNRLECIRVLKTSTVQHTASVGFSFTPASASIAYAAANYAFNQDPSSSLQFFVEGSRNTNDRWNLMGLNGGFSLKTEIGQLPTITFDFKEGANWASSSQGSLLQTANYTDATPPPFVDGLVYLNSINTDLVSAGEALSPIDVASFEITPNVSYTSVMSERGVNNILRKRRERSVPVATGKFISYYEDTNYFAVKDNITSTTTNSIGGTRLVDIGFQVGTIPGQTVFISMPACQLTNVNRVDAGGLAGVEVSFACFEPTHAVPANTLVVEEQDAAFSPLSIHFL